MHPTLKQMLERHARVAPADVEAIRNGLRDATCRLSPEAPWESGCAALLPIYERKAANLARFDTEHARSLREEVERLCLRLAAAGDVKARWWSFELERGRTLNLIENSGTGELLGVLHALDRRKVSAEEWAELWGTDVEQERAWRRTPGRMIPHDDPEDGPA